MNVFFINLFWDAACCSYFQHEAINKHTNWKARHFRAIRTFYENKDLTVENYNKDEFVSLIESADIIEFCSAHHHRQDEAENLIRQTYPKFSFGFRFDDVLKNKVKVYHDYNSFSGQWEDRAKEKDYWDTKKQIGYDAIFSSIPQSIFFYNECIYIPDVFEHRDIKRDFSEVVLGHFPTGGGNNKNTEELKRAINLEPVKSIIPSKTIYHNELLKEKNKINIAFDALWRGFHGMTTVENIAMGIPTMCRIDFSFWQAYKEFFQTDFNPFENVSNEIEIAECLKKYKNNLDMLKERSEKIAEFGRDIWSYKNVANKIVQTYERILK